MNFDFDDYLIFHSKINLRWIIDRSIKGKTIKLKSVNQTSLEKEQPWITEKWLWYCSSRTCQKPPSRMPEKAVHGFLKKLLATGCCLLYLLQHLGPGKVARAAGAHCRLKMTYKLHWVCGLTTEEPGSKTLSSCSALPAPSTGKVQCCTSSERKSAQRAKVHLHQEGKKWTWSWEAINC